MTEKRMTKIHVSLPNHWLVGGESLWGSPVEGEPEHYTVENVPYFAYGVSIGDVVRAVDSAEHPREVVAVVRPSGNLTVRIMFAEGVSEERQGEIVRQLRGELETRHEKGFENFWALSVDAARVEACLERLRVLREEGVLDLETGEQRVEGSFDADPDEE